VMASYQFKKELLPVPSVFPPTYLSPLTWKSKLWSNHGKVPISAIF